MSSINLTPGPVSPSDYMKLKLKVKSYENEHECVPLKKMKKSVTKIETGAGSDNSLLHNLLTTLLHKYGSGICETYFNNETPIVSFSYKVNQGAFNKKEMVSIHVFPQGEEHKKYYITSIAIKNNMVDPTILKLW